MAADKKYLLSIDGGGILGIIPLCLLVKLEHDTGKKSREVFSFVSGTSTGALIAGGLAVGVPAEQLLEFYINLSSKILKKTIFSLPKRIIKGYMYSTALLHSMILDELGEMKDIELNDLPVDILITSKRIRDSKPFYFVKDHKKNSCRFGKAKLADVVTASASAPTFFHPWEVVTPDGKTTGKLTDGAVGVAGNPVYVSCVEAFYYNSYHPKDTVVISLGTSRFAEPHDPHWLGDWFQWLLGEMFSSPGEQQTEIVNRHFPESPFYRLDPDLKELDPTLEKKIELDDVDKIPQLLKYGKQFAEIVDWKNILDGTDQKFKVTDKNTLWYQYKRPKP
jgi:hypothetical protein